MDDLSLELLETCYLPFAANTTSVADNAKVGLCVEGLVRVFERNVGVRWSEGLEERVRVGVRRREERAQRDGRRRGEGVGEGERAWLRGAGERIVGVVEMARGRAGRVE